MRATAVDYAPVSAVDVDDGLVSCSSLSSVNFDGPRRVWYIYQVTVGGGEECPRLLRFMAQIKNNYLSNWKIVQCNNSSRKWVVLCSLVQIILFTIQVNRTGKLLKSPNWLSAHLSILLISITLIDLGQFPCAMGAWRFKRAGSSSLCLPINLAPPRLSVSCWLPRIQRGRALSR